MEPHDAARGEDDTQPAGCVRCAARAALDAAVVRAGAERVTIVSSYSRPRVGRCAVERTSALVCLPGGVIVRGEGHSREEALEDALRNAGVTL